MRALVTGATGFVGRRLLARLERPVVLSRNPATATLAEVELRAWNPSHGPPPAEVFDDIDVVFHLAGEPVAEGRWTSAKKARIRDSRLLGTQRLVAGIEQARRRPSVLVSASAVGIYGSRGDEWLDESAAPGHDFLAEVCQGWEHEALAAEALGMRVVTHRIGIILGPGGGALSRMLPLFRCGLGGRLGNGRQWMPWVHVDDVVGLMLFAATHAAARGALNTVAPQAVTNRDFTKVLARVVRRPALFPAPAWGLRLGLGGFADVLLGSQRVLPMAAQKWGYNWNYSDLEGALRAVVSGQG